MAFVNGEVFAIRVDAAGPHGSCSENNPPARADDAGAGYSVVVRSGDTISGIAARTGLWPVTAWSVPSGNINRIWPGQTVVYRGNSTPTVSTGATGTRIHVVKSGETLSGIFGASGWQRVAQLNNLRNRTSSIPDSSCTTEHAAVRLRLRPSAPCRRPQFPYLRPTNLRRTLMDISAATTLAAGIVALIAPALVQAFKKYIPADYVGLTSLGVSVLLGVIAIAATNGFHGYGWGIVLTGVIGVAQAVYTLVNQAFSGKLSKDEPQE